MSTFKAHILGPDVHASRPAASACPTGTVYKCTTHNKIELNSDGATWIDWADLTGTASATLTTKGDLLAYDSALTRLAVGTNGKVLTADSTQAAGMKWNTPDTQETLMIAVSDEVTAITTGTAKVTFRMPWALTVTAVRASLTTASSSGLPTVDINESGTTILSTKLTIDATKKTSTTAATPAVISDTALADDAEITIDITVAGTGAKGLKVYIIGNR